MSVLAFAASPLFRAQPERVTVHAADQFTDNHYTILCIALLILPSVLSGMQSSARACRTMQPKVRQHQRPRPLVSLRTLGRRYLSKSAQPLKAAELQHCGLACYRYSSSRAFR
jgi:hypothetical protein